MKIKKIAAVCKARGKCYLYDYTDADGVVEQWIGNGAAMYPVTGMPYLQLDNITTLFELTSKQADKLHMEKAEAPEIIDLRDAVVGEVMAQKSELHISSGSVTILPVTANGNTRFLDESLIAPVQARYDDIEYWLRRMPDGTPYYAVKEGLMLVGIVMPLHNMDAVAELLSDIGESYREDEL